MDKCGPVEKHKCYEQPPFLRRRRNVVAFLSYLGFCNLYMLRMNLTVAIMANEFPSSNPTTRGFILCSFFLGYVATQLFGGFLSSQMGGVKLIGYSILSTAFLTLLMPKATLYSTNLLILIRIVEGVFNGVVFPSIYAVWMRWAPPDERSHLGSIAFAGSFMGVACGYVLCGWLVQDYGWSYAFYIPGLISMIWAIVWLAFVTESPIDDKHITLEELNYIVNSIGPIPKEIDRLYYPWMDFFTSKPLFAIICAHFSANWGNNLLLTQLPNYMNKSWHSDIKYPSYYTALPYIFLSNILLFSGFFADWLSKNKHLDTTLVRKLFCCSAFMSQSIFILFLATQVNCGLNCIVFLSIAQGLGAFAWAAITANHLDIGPQYSSMLMAISNTFATIPGIVIPVLDCYFRDSNKDDQKFKPMFYITSGIFLLGAILYGIFASGKRQPWAIVEAAKGNTIIIRRSIGIP